MPAIQRRNSELIDLLSGEFYKRDDALTGYVARIDGSGGGLYAGLLGDVQWYRHAADFWRTPDTVIVDGKIGIGTPTVPHGGVGVALLAIEGVNATGATGPNVQFTTASDDYPLLQVLPFAHDNVALNFDAYFDGTNWKSSHAGANFQIYKNGSRLNFYGATGVAAGGTISPWTLLMSLAPTGNPRARVYNSAAISLTHNTVTMVTFNSERVDTDGIHSTSTNTGRLTCVTAGTYMITAYMQFAQNGTGRRMVAIKLNNTTYIAMDKRTPLSTDQTVVVVPCQWDLVAGDFLTVDVFQDSGGALNLEAASAYSPEFAMVKIP